VLAVLMSYRKRFNGEGVFLAKGLRG
jgi:hypothetical protein